jgi:hypothetical protein
MNLEIHNAFVNAVLADASYVEGLLPDDKDGILAGKLERRLTGPLAQYVGQNYRVVTQYTDPSFVNGFSVTVFEDRLTGQRYMSIRGMESIFTPSDSLSAANVSLFTGLAGDQTISMINWYLRATSPSGVPVVQLSRTVHDDPTTGQVVNDTFMGTGEGTLLGGGPLMLDNI